MLFTYSTPLCFSHYFSNKGFNDSKKGYTIKSIIRVDTLFVWDDFETALWVFFVLLLIVSFIHQLGHYTMARIFIGRSVLILGRGKELFKYRSIRVNRIHFLDAFVIIKP